MTKRSAKADARSSASGGLFLSYNSSDRAAIVAIRNALEQRKVSTFLDRTDLTPGLPWVTGLENALQKVSGVVVFIGPNGLGQWQKREMQFGLDRQAKEEKAGRTFPVIPVMLPQSDLGMAPGFLLLNTWIDLSKRLDDAVALDALAGSSRGRPLAFREQDVVLCPYRALQAFREEDAGLFFGRETFAAQLQQKLSERKLILVAGPSGSGKSSVVQAGVLPLLRKQRVPTYDCLTFTPSDRPFHRLASALVGIWTTEKSNTERLQEAEQLGEHLRARSISMRSAVEMALEKSTGTDRLLIVIDQFEELFTLSIDEERRAFVEALLDAAEPNPINIILTLRADFFSQAIGLSRRLSDCIQEGLINIGPMTREELHRAIEKPGAAVGLQFEPGLVDRIVEQVEKQPGSLPLLEFALTELFGNGSNRIFTHAAYNEIGGVEGAVAKRAEAVFTRLNAGQQKTASRNLSRLVRVTSANEEGSDTRQRILRRELDLEAEGAFQEFVRARLLVTGRNENEEPTIEVAHEALIRNWERLGKIVNQNREFLQWRQRLGLLLIEWERTGKEPALLLRGALLTEAAKWLANPELEHREQDLSERERGFILASMQEQSEASRLPSWANAREMTDPLSKALALEDVVETLAGSSLEQAKLAANETLAAARQVHDEKQRSRGLNSAVTALITAQETETALDVARTITESDYRSGALTKLAEQLVHAGKLDDALQIAKEIELPLDLGKLAEELAKQGRSQEILEIAQAVADPDKRLRSQTAVVEAMASAGRIDEALGAACKLCDPYTFGTLAPPLADAGRLMELLRAVGALPNLNIRRQSFNRIADEFVRLERGDLLQKTASDVTDPICRSLIYGGLAEARGRAGQHKEAIDIAKEITDFDLQSETLQALAEFAARDAKTEDAVAIALSLPLEDQRSAFSWIAATLLQQGKIVQFTEAVKSLSDARVRSRALSGIGRTLARTGDIDAAITLAKEAADPYLMTDLAASVVFPGGIGKIAEILDISGAFPGNMDQQTAFRCVATTLVPAGKKEVLLDAARRITDHRKKFLALVEIACVLARVEGAQEARAVIRDISDPKAYSEAELRIVETFVEMERIAEALDAAQEISDPFALSQIAESLAQLDRIDESLQIAARISDPYVLSALLRILADTDRGSEVLSLAGKFPDPEERRMVFENMAKEFSHCNKLNALLESALGVADPALRTDALEPIGIQMARNGDCARAAQIVTEIPSPKKQAITLSLIADIAAQNGNIDDALALAVQISSGSVQKRAFARMGKSLVDLDLTQPWLDALLNVADPTIRSYGLSGVVEALCDSNRYVEAIVLAAAISDEDEQIAAYSHCAAVCSTLPNIKDLGQSLLNISKEDVRYEALTRIMEAQIDLGLKKSAILLSTLLTDPLTRFKLIGWSLIHAGHLSEALQIALEIRQPDDRSRVIAAILRNFLKIDEANRVFSLAKTIDNLEERSFVLHEIVKTLREFGGRAEEVARELESELGDRSKRKPAKRERKPTTRSLKRR